MTSRDRLLESRVRPKQPRFFWDVLRMFKRPRDEREIYVRNQRKSGTFCFIHINKCGGRSVEKALGIPWIHDSAMQRRDKLGKARWEELRSFSIVRNPYSRVCSLYRYALKRGRLDPSVDINDWIRMRFIERHPGFQRNPLMNSPCFYWLCDEDGRLIVDLVVKLEDIDREWARVLEFIGETAPLGKENVTHTNTDVGDLDEDSIRYIKETFAPDFEAFGYSRDPQQASGSKTQSAR